MFKLKKKLADRQKHLISLMANPRNNKNRIIKSKVLIKKAKVALKTEKKKVLIRVKAKAKKEKALLRNSKAKIKANKKKLKNLMMKLKKEKKSPNKNAKQIKNDEKLVVKMIPKIKKEQKVEFNEKVIAKKEQKLKNKLDDLPGKIEKRAYELGLMSSRLGNTKAKR
jgi:hypothetical protein